MKTCNFFSLVFFSTGYRAKNLAPHNKMTFPVNAIFWVRKKLDAPGKKFMFLEKNLVVPKRCVAVFMS